MAVVSRTDYGQAESSRQIGALDLVIIAKNPPASASCRATAHPIRPEVKPATMAYSIM